TIAQELSGVSFIALDDFSTDLLILTNDFPVLFRVELGGEFRGVHEVAEHDGQLSSFSIANRRCSRGRFNTRGWLFLYSRRLCCLSRGSGGFMCTFGVASPDEPSPVIISHRVYVEEFGFEGFEILVIEAEPYLEGRIRHTSLAFEERNNLFQDVVKRHDRSSANSSNNAFASFKSAVSKPSVNQP